MSCCGFDGQAERSAAACCWACPVTGVRSMLPARLHGSAALTCGGQTVERRIERRAGGDLDACPRGRHPDARGRVRWLGVGSGGLVWLGVPMPIRLALWLVHGRHPRPSSFARCGCVLALKVCWRRARRWRRRVRTRRLRLRRELLDHSVGLCALAYAAVSGDIDGGDP